MSCMCGDTMCPSCGPAQGHDPTHERLVETLAEEMKDLLPDDEDQATRLLEWVATRVEDVQVKADNTLRQYIVGLLERAKKEGDTVLAERLEFDLEGL